MMPPIEERDPDTPVQATLPNIHQQPAKAYAAFLSICFALYVHDIEVQPRVSAHPTIMLFGRYPRPLYQRPRSGQKRLKNADLDDMLRWGYDKYTSAIMEYNKRYEDDVFAGLDRGEELDPLTRPLIVDAANVTTNDLDYMAMLIPILVQKVPGQIIGNRMHHVQSDISYYTQHWARTTLEEYGDKIDWTSVWAAAEYQEGRFRRLLYALAELVDSLCKLVPGGGEERALSEEVNVWAEGQLPHVEAVLGSKN